MRVNSRAVVPRAVTHAHVRVNRLCGSTLDEARVARKAKRTCINWQPHQQAVAQAALSLLRLRPEGAAEALAVEMAPRAEVCADAPPKEAAGEVLTAA